MRIEGLRPEVKQRLTELKENERPAETHPIDEAIAGYMANGEHDDWTVRTARRILEEDAEFLKMLGDR